VLALHYLKYDPREFRSSVVLYPGWSGGLSAVSKFGKFEFGGFDPANPPDGRSLIFASLREAVELPADAQRGVVRNKDGSVAYIVLEYSK